MQNIIRYGVEGPQPGPADGEKPSFGIVMVSENDGHMDVIAGNYVANDEAGLLVDRVRLSGACDGELAQTNGGAAMAKRESGGVMENLRSAARF